jgi:hypothetical protein
MRGATIQPTEDNWAAVVDAIARYHLRGAAPRSVKQRLGSRNARGSGCLLVVHDGPERFHGLFRVLPRKVPYLANFRGPAARIAAASFFKAAFA